MFTYAGSYPYAHLPGLEAAGRFDFLESKGGGLIFLGINLDKAPGDLPVFRKALGLSLTVKSVDLPTWQALKDGGAYHLSLSRTIPWGMRMHAGWASGYFDSRRAGAGLTGTIRDPAFHELCDRLSTAAQPETILKLAHRIQMDYAQRLPALALFQPRIFSPVSRA